MPSPLESTFRSSGFWQCRSPGAQVALTDWIETTMDISRKNKYCGFMVIANQDRFVSVKWMPKYDNAFNSKQVDPDSNRCESHMGVRIETGWESPGVIDPTFTNISESHGQDRSLAGQQPMLGRSYPPDGTSTRLLLHKSKSRRDFISKNLAWKPEAYSF